MTNGLAQVKFLQEKKIRYSLVIISVILVIYLSSYVFFSLSGSYKLVGHPNYTKQQWQPKYSKLHYDVNENGDRVLCANILGIIFCPIIVLDRKFIHTSQIIAIDTLFDEDNEFEDNTSREILDEYIKDSPEKNE